LGDDLQEAPSAPWLGDELDAQGDARCRCGPAGNAQRRAEGPRVRTRSKNAGGRTRAWPRWTRLVDDLLERLLDDDLGVEYLATRRDENGYVVVEGDRWGMLRLAGEALRLAAGRGNATASLDGAGYLEEVDDIVIFKRVPTPPRWWNDDEED
jgi:hypothetical protein